ncbi:peptidase associated/transthyretin-like domain-containing protein [Nonlabens antarcticus]|uniref:hypothetical protein n=1 Tax=Nonlabens antarcticus TaxID=392714 RepID=UPI001891D5AB|nr:hypothetical protein [Nonlabens antarcticus]
MSILFFITANSLYAQSLKGTLSVENIPVQYIVVSNISNGTVTYSDQEGYFEIKAQVFDTVSFTSIFYKTKTIVLKEYHFEEKILINLTESINNLAEITVNTQKFDKEEYNMILAKQLAYDIDKNMQAYETPSNGLVDVVKIIKRINKLSNKKQKKPIQEENYASYPELSSLFEKAVFLNNKKLNELLIIKDDRVSSFLDFCTEKINKELLKENNQFLLLDRLITLSLEFDRN